jgi:lysozyme
MNELLEKLKALFGNAKNAPSAPTSPLQSIASPQFGEPMGPGPAVVSPVNEARDMIMRHEGFRANAYRDAAGKPTIGYGKTQGVKMGDVITEPQAYKDMMTHIRRDSADWHGRKFRDVPPELYSASYNLGVRGTLAPEKAGLEDPLRAGDYEEASRRLLMANRAGGEEQGGLTKRRQEEADLLRAYPQRKAERDAAALVDRLMRRR